MLKDIVTLVNTQETPLVTAGGFLDVARTLDESGFPGEAARARQLVETGWPWGMYRGEPLLAELFMLTALGASAKFAQPGDSGSLIVDDNTPSTAIGLLWGGDQIGFRASASDITRVENNLGISTVWA